MPGAARRDDNREVALIAQNLLGTQPLFITGLSLTNATPLHVAMVDANGDQITSFGGGTQYLDGGVPPAHPTGNTIEWSDGANWQTVSTAKPLPVSGSFSLTNPSTGAAVPSTANYVAVNKGGNLTGLLMGSQITANSLAVALAADQVAIPVDTEMAAALAVGDGIATQTTAPVVAYPVIFNGGTTFDRVRGGQGDGAGATGLQDMVPRVYNGSTYDRLRGDTSGLYAQVRASTTGGYTPGKLISAASTNATSVKGSAGTLGFVSVQSINAAARYLKFYDKASAPTVGSDTPVLVLLIPGNTAGTGNNPAIPPQGLLFSNGIALALTTGITDADTGAVAANEIAVNYGYK